MSIQELTLNQPKDWLDIKVNSLTVDNQVNLAGSVVVGGDLDVGGVFVAASDAGVVGNLTVQGRVDAPIIDSLADLSIQSTGNMELVPDGELTLNPTGPLNIQKVVRFTNTDPLKDVIGDALFPKLSVTQFAPQLINNTDVNGVVLADSVIFNSDALIGVAPEGTGTKFTLPSTGIYNIYAKVQFALEDAGLTDATDGNRILYLEYYDTGSLTWEILSQVNCGGVVLHGLIRVQDSLVMHHALDAVAPGLELRFRVFQNSGLNIDINSDNNITSAFECSIFKMA